MMCPACQHPLHVGFELAENQFIAWCGHGPCPSYMANDGEYGRTEEQAMENLIRKMNANKDWDQNEKA